MLAVSATRHAILHTKPLIWRNSSLLDWFPPVRAPLADAGNSLISLFSLPYKPRPGLRATNRATLGRNQCLRNSRKILEALGTGAMPRHGLQCVLATLPLRQAQSCR